MFAKVQHFEQSLLPIATNTSSARDDLKPTCIRGDIDIKSHDKNQAPSNRLYRQLRNGQVEFIDKLKTNFVLDYLSGSFDKDYFNTTSIKYGSIILGIQPTFNYFKNEKYLS